MRAIRRGYSMPLSQCWELGKAWYAGRLDLDWQIRTEAETQALLERVGLHDSFWQPIPD